jgi:hypothetical protein
MVTNKALREGGDDGVSSYKQTQYFDMLDHHDVKVSLVNKPSSMSMVEMLIVKPTLAPIPLVNQWLDKRKVTQIVFQPCQI